MQFRAMRINTNSESESKNSNDGNLGLFGNVSKSHQFLLTARFYIVKGEASQQPLHGAQFIGLQHYCCTMQMSFTKM